MSERSDSIYRVGADASEKFDYFITGVAGALFAYIAQTYAPKKFEFSSAVLEPIALVFLAGAFFCGVRRIECVNTAKRLNHQMIDSSEKAGTLLKSLSEASGPYMNTETGEVSDRSQAQQRYERYRERATQADTLLKRVASHAQAYYDSRFRLLVGGFACIFLAKVLSPYV